jgi:RNA polymerase sigma-70 factor (ECF subfamily)
LPEAPEDFRAWLMAHATKAYNQHNWSWRRYTRTAYRQYHEPRATGTADPAAWAGATPHTDESMPVHEADVAQVLTRLRPEQRRAVQLRYLDEIPRDLTAEALGRTPEAVRMLERRGLARLREEFGDRASTPRSATPVRRA